MPWIVEPTQTPESLEEFIYAHRIPLSTSQQAYLRFKRLTDVVLSALALLILLIPLIAIIFVQKISSPHEPAIFRQKRVGRCGKVFTMYKFRTMKTTAPKYAATKEFEDAEQYISRLGHILRSTSVDELPQLFNVLKGDMSLIGPRPLIPQEDEVHYLRAYYGIDQLRPGITGWAQVNGRDLLDDYDKVFYDREYLKRVSAGFDMKVFWWSVLKVLVRRDIREGHTNTPPNDKSAKENGKEIASFQTEMSHVRTIHEQDADEYEVQQA